MTTLTVSGSAAGQTTTVWMPIAGRACRADGRRRPASVGVDSPVTSVRFAARALVGVEVGDAASAVRPGASKTTSAAARLPPKSHVPPAKRTSSMPASASSRGSRPCSCARSRACPGRGPRRSSGCAPRAPGRRPAPSRRRCTDRSDRTTAGGSPAQAARTSAQRARAAARRERSVGAWPEGTGGWRAKRCGARGRGASWHLVRPSRSGARVRPTIDPGQVGTEGAIARRRQGGRTVLHTPTRDRTGEHTWGVGHGSGDRTLSRGGSREGSRAQITSRVTGSSAIRPGRRRDGSTHRWRDTSSAYRSPSGYPGGDLAVRADQAERGPLRRRPGAPVSDGRRRRRPGRRGRPG